MRTPTAAARPAQAVILAGGRGTRLGPLTDDRPKPMIEVNGEPFLESLIRLLRREGIERVLLLLGYRAEVVTSYLAARPSDGMRIEQATTPPEYETARRLHEARDHLDPTFLLMYSDNYWPMDLGALSSHRAALETPALVTVYRNADGWSRGHNVRVEAPGLVTAYDPTRGAPGLEGVEIGYAILERDLLDLVDELNAPIERVLYPELIARRELAAYVTDHRYYSIGSPERLLATQAFLSGPPTLLLDRDGVLNQRMPRATYVRRPEEFEWLPGALDAVRDLTRAGFRMIVVSNQAGVARGAMSATDLEDVEATVRRDVEAAGGRIEAFYYCTHDWDAGCACRKPLPGLFYEAQRDFALDLRLTPYVGDDDRDRQAAEAAGMPFLQVDDAQSLHDLAGVLCAGVAKAAYAAAGSAGGIDQ